MLTLEEISAIFHRADLLGLVRMGAPNDEYGPEAKIVHSFLYKGEQPDFVKSKVRTSSEFVRFVHDLFAHMFDGHGPDAKDPRLQQAALEIWKRR